MAKPQNIDEYYEKMQEVRSMLKSFKNEMVVEENGVPAGTAVDLHKVTDANLLVMGLNETAKDYERARLNAMKDVYDSLKAFDNACV